MESKKGSVVGKEKEKEKEVVIVLDKKGEEKRQLDSKAGKKKCCE